MFDQIKIKLRKKKKNKHRPKHPVPSVRSHKQYLFIFRKKIKKQYKKEALLQSG